MRKPWRRRPGCFKKGFAYRSLPELALLLEHSDQRVRQASQFAMVEKGAEAIGVFSELTKGEAKSGIGLMHALWGLGQLYRQGRKVPRRRSRCRCLVIQRTRGSGNAARVVEDSLVVEGQK